MPLRVLLALAAVVVVAFALVRGSDVRACDDARGAAFVAAIQDPPRAPADGGRTLASRVVDACRGSDGLVLSSQSLLRAGAIDAAERLAREALERDPDAFQAHNVLAAVLDARGRPEEAAGERARARDLNPLAPPPAGPRIGPDGRPLSG